MLEDLTRRRFLTLGPALVMGACGRKKGSGYAGYALVGTAGEKSVAVVDLTTFRLARTIPLGAEPTAIVPGGPGGTTYVLTPATGTVYALDAALNVKGSRRLADQLSEIRVTPDRRVLAGISAPSRELVYADASSLRLIARLKLAALPAALDVPPAPEFGNAPNPPYAAVSLGETGVVELYDLAAGKRWQKQLPGLIGTVRFRADAGVLLVGNLATRSLTVLKTPSLDVITDLPLAMEPQNLCFNADQGQLFISGDGMDGVAIVFPYQFEVDQTVLAGRDPGVMACSAAPPYLFVGSNSGSEVCILNIDTRKVIGSVDVGQRPTYITITPDNQYALILDEAAGSMAVIRIPSIRSYHAKSGSSGYWLPRLSASLFTVLPVGDKPVHAAVVPRAV